MHNFTNSLFQTDFDHVAMCIWDQSQELYILEAVMPDGVRTIPFSEVIDDLGDWYDKVVLRHLEFERTDE